MPFVTEEVWSWFESGSVHRAAWPDAAPLRLDDADPLVFEVAADVLAAVRKEKSEQKRSLRTPVERVVVHDTAERSGRARARRIRSLRGGQDRRAHDRDRHRAPRRGRARSPQNERALGAARAAGVARCAREPRDRRRRAGADPRAGRTHARAHRRAAAIPRLAPARVPGRPPDRHEREDLGDANGHGAPLDRRTRWSARRRARIWSASTSA